MNRFGSFSDWKKSTNLLTCSTHWLKYISAFAYVFEYLEKNEALHLIRLL